MGLKRIIISPPFGNWVGMPGCTRVLGSFTLEPRPGLIKQTMRTLRRVPGGWVNQIGLRNPGIRSVTRWRDDRIYSVVGLDTEDWSAIFGLIPPGLTVEINLGCPNVHRYGIEPRILRAYCNKFNVIAKLSPDDRVDAVASMCVQAGVRYLHLSNTLVTDLGGESGGRLFAQNLAIVSRLARRYPQVRIIAGGGIYSWQRAQAYLQMGADHLSLSTVWFSPFRAIWLLWRMRFGRRIWPRR